MNTLLENINNLSFNNNKSIIIFKYIVKQKINYSKSNNNIFFDFNNLSNDDINIINNIINE